MKKFFFNEALWIDFLSITLVILLAIIVYRFLIRFLSRKHINTEKYCTLFDVEDQPVRGVIPFYFSTKIARNVEFVLESAEGCRVANIANQAFEAGGHLLKFDSSALKDGTYFYLLRTENQEIRKKLVIKN
jgi:hypothetical protein